MAIAFVFPGQGSQAVGMLAALAKRESVIETTFSEASEVLGYDLWTLVQEGPEATLRSTVNAQPALLAGSVALWRLWCIKSEVRPLMMAGHSLGEYAALVAASVIDFADSIRLVAERGQYMQEAVPEGVGRMAAILGLTLDQVHTLCAAAAAGQTVVAANDNAPGQIVIAGHQAAVERALELARAQGAKRTIFLPVSVPSHCPLMESAAERLAKRLDALSFNTPKVPVLRNTDALSHGDSGAIREALARQLCLPVRWVETVQCMAEAGVGRVVECGPGRVLSGLVKRIDKKLAVFSIDDPLKLDETLATLKTVDGANDDI